MSVWQILDLNSTSQRLNFLLRKVELNGGLNLLNFLRLLQNDSGLFNLCVKVFGGSLDLLAVSLVGFNVLFKFFYSIIFELL